MKSILTLSVALSPLWFASCSTTTVVKPEPTTVTESVRRTSSSSSYSPAPGYSTTPAESTTTETRSVTTE